MLKHFFTAILSLALFTEMGSHLSALAIKKLDPETLGYQPPVMISLEHATTVDQRNWGLMGRTRLAEDSGMAFTYPHSQKISLWMFNTFIDLSAAILDEDKVIREVYNMKSFPRVMNPDEPVRNVKDLKKFMPDDEVIQFFIKQCIFSTFPAKYAVEMNYRWFEKNNIYEGDFVVWEDKSPVASAIHSLDLGKLPEMEEQLFLLNFPDENYQGVWNPDGSIDYDIAFINSKGVVEQVGTLKGGEEYEESEIPVLKSAKPAKAIVIGLEGWLSEQRVKVGSKMKM